MKRVYCCWELFLSLGIFVLWRGRSKFLHFFLQKPTSEDASFHHIDRGAPSNVYTLYTHTRAHIHAQTHTHTYAYTHTHTLLCTFGSFQEKSEIKYYYQRLTWQSTLPNPILLYLDLMQLY